MHGYDFIVRWISERYRSLPDIALCCHKNNKKLVHYSWDGRRGKKHAHTGLYIRLSVLRAKKIEICKRYYHEIEKDKSRNRDKKDIIFT